MESLCWLFRFKSYFHFRFLSRHFEFLISADVGPCRRCHFKVGHSRKCEAAVGNISLALSFKGFFHFRSHFLHLSSRCRRMSGRVSTDISKSGMVKKVVVVADAISFVFNPRVLNGWVNLPPDHYFCCHFRTAWN